MRAPARLASKNSADAASVFLASDLGRLVVLRLGDDPQLLRRRGLIEQRAGHVGLDVVVFLAVDHEKRPIAELVEGPGQRRILHVPGLLDLLQADVRDDREIPVGQQFCESLPRRVDEDPLGHVRDHRGAGCSNMLPGGRRRRAAGSSHAARMPEAASLLEAEELGSRGSASGRLLQILECDVVVFDTSKARHPLERLVAVHGRRLLLVGADSGCRRRRRSRLRAAGSRQNGFGTTVPRRAGNSRPNQMTLFSAASSRLPVAAAKDDEGRTGSAARCPRHRDRACRGAG